jgi:hypothetical protein
MKHTPKAMREMAEFLANFKFDEAHSEHQWRMQEKAAAMLREIADEMESGKLMKLDRPARVGVVTLELVQQLRGRAKYLRDIGRIKSPQLMERAADAIDAHLSAQRAHEIDIADMPRHIDDLRQVVERLEKENAELRAQRESEAVAVAVRFIKPDGSVFGQGWKNYTNQKLPVGWISDGWKMELAYSYPPHPRAVTDEMVERVCQALFVGNVRKPWPWRETIDEPDAVFAQMRAAIEAALSPEDGV